MRLLAAASPRKAGGAHQRRRLMPIDLHGTGFPGVEFIPEDGGGAGVRLRKPDP